MIKQGFFISIFLFGFAVFIKPLKSQDIAPQIWTNASVAWVINDRFSWRNNAAYNVLVSSEFPWDEITLTSTGVFKFANFFEATTGIYSALTKQTGSLSSFEVRPFIGFRASTNIEKRWLLSNLSRLELRYLNYSDGNSNNVSLRFRNRTIISVSLIKKTMSINKNNLFVFGYFEAFFNFRTEVRERFFNQFKYKLGLGYRINYHWGIDFGVIFQDATNNVTDPVVLPTTLITNYIFEWGVRFVIGPKGG
jgi:hypothetical protein